MAVLLTNTLIKLRDVSPFIRNTDVVGSPLQDKAGPHGLWHDGVKWRCYFEAVERTTVPTIPRTGFMLAKADVLQGPWQIINPNRRLIEPLMAPVWENNELSAASAVWEGHNNRWVIWCHGGNNGYPPGNCIGVAYSTDGIVGEKFVRDAGNPIISQGTPGGTYDQGPSNPKIQRISDGTYLGFITGRKIGGVTNGTVHRVTGTQANNLVVTGECIVAGSAGQWNDQGQYPGFWWIDPENRLHMFVAAADGTTRGIGYFYSDDLGVTFTQYGSNPVMIADGDNGPFHSTADVGQGAFDGDVLLMTSGGETVAYTGPPPAVMRGQHMFITPARVTSPRRTGKFYLVDGGPSYTAVLGTSILSQTLFTMMGRFKAYRTRRGFIVNHLFTERSAAAIGSYCRIESGKFSVVVANGTSFQMLSQAYFDDGLWHTWAVRRLGTASFELWVDGVRVATDSTSIASDASTTFKAVGNWHPSTFGFGGTDEPSQCTISDFISIVGQALTWQQCEAIIASRTFPAGVSADIDFPTAGTDSGGVVVVEAGLNPPILTQPVDAYVEMGGSATFTVAAKCIGTPSYQWKKNYVNVGSNSPSYTLSPITSSHQHNVITCTVTDSAGVSTTREAYVFLNPASAYLWDTSLT